MQFNLRMVFSFSTGFLRLLAGVFYVAVYSGLVIVFSNAALLSDDFQVGCSIGPIPGGGGGGGVASPSLEQGLQISISVWNRVYFLPCNSGARSG